MARAVTAPELTKLRSDSQFSKLYLGGNFDPEEVFRCQINQTFTVYDGIVEITYNNVTLGAYTDIEVEMTGYVGTTPGAKNRGLFRIRKAPTSSILYIGETSEIQWADDLYITVVKDFSIWPKHIRVDGSTFWMDYDVVYSDQHQNPNPVPVLGPPIVVWLTGATVQVPMSASNSWVLGSTISGYSWVCADADSITGASTATPTLIFSSPGVFLVKCTVTAANGKSTAGYRFVFVYNEVTFPPLVDFEVLRCSGNFIQGGWTFEVTVYLSSTTQATLASFFDRAYIVLFSRDYYQGKEQYIGPVSGSENVLAAGWVDGETITVDPLGGSVTFRVSGPQYWLGRITGFPSGIEDTDFADNGGGAPNRWTEFQDLTIDKMLWHFLYWRSSLVTCNDLYLTGDTRQLATLEAPVGTLWTQATVIANAILAKSCCDRFGRLFIELETNFLPVVDRTSIPVVMEITPVDRRDELIIDRIIVQKISQVDISGTYWNNGNVTAICAKAYGTVFGRYGNIERVDRVAFSSQTQPPELAGLVLADRNNEFPTVAIPLVGFNKMIDICPRQIVTISLDAEDNARGLYWSTKRFIPKELSYSALDREGGCIEAELTVAAETLGTHGTTVACPEFPAITPFVWTPPDLVFPPWPMIPLGISPYQRNQYLVGLETPADTNVILDSPMSVASGLRRTLISYSSSTYPTMFVSDDKYVYYLVIAPGVDDRIYYQALEDAGDTGYIEIQEDEGITNICVLEQKRVAVVSYNSVLQRLSMRDFNFTAGTQTIRTSRFNTAEWEFSNNHNMLTVLTLGGLVTIFDASWTWTGVDADCKLECYKFDWSTLAETIEEVRVYLEVDDQELFTWSGDRQPPVVIGDYVVMFYSPPWSGTVTNGYALIVCVRASTFEFTSLQIDAVGPGYGDRVSVVEGVPYIDTGTLYTYVFFRAMNVLGLPLETNLCFVRIPDLVMYVAPLGGATLARLIFSPIRAYWIDTSGNVRDCFTGALKRTLSISCPTWLTCDALCRRIDSLNRIWYLNGTNLYGYGIDDANDETIFNSVPSATLSRRLYPLGSYFIVIRKESSGATRYYMDLLY